MESRIIFFCFICFAAFTSLQAQSPYYTNWTKDIVGTTIGLTGIGVATWLNHNNEGLTAHEISSLDKMSIPKFDRFATILNSVSAKKWSDVLFYGAVAAPGLFIFKGKIRKDYQILALMYFETLSLTAAATLLSKRLTLRNRPYTYSPEISLVQKMEKDARNSFFSGHTSITAAATFFTAKVIHDYYPSSKWKSLIWVIAATIPAATATFRVGAGKHFPSDVITGYAVGAFFGMMIPSLHKMKCFKSEKLKIQISPGNALFLLKFNEKKETKSLVYLY